jgi:hypothetical protein
VNDAIDVRGGTTVSVDIISSEQNTEKILPRGIGIVSRTLTKYEVRVAEHSHRDIGTGDGRSTRSRKTQSSSSMTMEIRFSNATSRVING